MLGVPSEKIPGAIEKGIGDLLGPDVATDGQLAASLTFAGTVGAPKVSGFLTGQDIDVALYDQGIRLTKGVVRVALAKRGRTMYQHVDKCLNSGLERMLQLLEPGDRQALFRIVERLLAQVGAANQPPNSQPSPSHLDGTEDT